VKLKGSFTGAEEHIAIPIRFVLSELDDGSNLCGVKFWESQWERFLKIKSRHNFFRSNNQAEAARKDVKSQNYD
jgi:hypothetical protein